MLRKLIGSAVTLLLLVGAVMADEVKAKFVKFDEEKKVLTVSIKDGDKDKETTYTITDKTKVFTQKGSEAKKPIDYVKMYYKDGTALVLTVEKKDGQEELSEIKYAPKKK